MSQDAYFSRTVCLARIACAILVLVAAADGLGVEKEKLMLLSAVVIGDRVRDGMVGAAMEFVQQMQNKGILRY